MRLSNGKEVRGIEVYGANCGERHCFASRSAAVLSTCGGGR